MSWILKQRQESAIFAFLANPKEKGRISMVEVDMGSPVLEADQVPVICEHTLAIDEPITVNGVEYRMTEFLWEIPMR